MADNTYDSLLERDLRDKLDQRGWQICRKKRRMVGTSHSGS